MIHCLWNVINCLATWPVFYINILISFLLFFFFFKHESSYTQTYSYVLVHSLAVEPFEWILKMLIKTLKKKKKTCHIDDVLTKRQHTTVNFKESTSKKKLRNVQTHTQKKKSQKVNKKHLNTMYNSHLYNIFQTT